MASILFPHLNYEHAPGFTPVRRPDRGIFTESPALASHAPWTTTRCNRLLRPLSSRIASLHKNRHEVARVVKEVEIKIWDGRNRERVGSRVPESTTCSVRPEDDGGDPDWAPENPPKKLKRTYSNKGSAGLDRKAGRPRAVPTRVLGELSITAPLLNAQDRSSQTDVERREDTDREVNLWMNSQDIENETHAGKSSTRTYHKNTQASARDSFRRLAKSVAPSQWMLYDGLYTGLDALLKATTKTTPPPTTGTQSLFATCLRRVPEYIDLEQAWADEEDEDSKEDLTTTIYNELESHGCSAAGGWKPLKQVTRALGITMIGKAIHEGIIHPLLGKGLITLCLDVSAFEEAESLCLYLLQNTQRIAYPKSAADELFRSAIGLRTLRNIADRTSRWGFFYRTLATLFENDVIPVEWISSPDMIEPWNMAIASIAQQDGFHSYASRLFQVVISLSYRVDGEKSSQNLTERIKTLRAPDQVTSTSDTISNSLDSTMSNLMTVLISVTKTKSTSTGNVFDTRLTAALSASNLIHLMSLQALYYTQKKVTKGSSTTNQLERAFLPLLAHIILSPVKSVEEPSISSSKTITTLPKPLEKLSDKTIDILTTFISSSAHSCSITDSPLLHIQIFLSNLLAYFASTTLQPRISKLAIATAFHFAEKTPVPAYLDWALEFEESIERDGMDNSRHVGRGILAKKERSGGGNEVKTFRYEEGIGEWVAKTPLVVIRSKSVMNFGVKGKQKQAVTSTDTTTLSSSPHSSPRSSPSRSNSREMSQLESSPLPRLLELTPFIGRKEKKVSETSILTYGTTPQPKFKLKTRGRGRPRKLRFSSFLSDDSISPSTSASISASRIEHKDTMHNLPNKNLEETDELSSTDNYSFFLDKLPKDSVAVVIPSIPSLSYPAPRTSRETEMEIQKKRKRGRPPGRTSTSSNPRSSSSTTLTKRKSMRQVDSKSTKLVGRRRVDTIRIGLRRSIGSEVSHRQGTEEEGSGSEDELA